LALKAFIRTFAMLLLLLLSGSTQFAHAQNASVYFGLGSAHDSSSGQQINTFGTGTVFNTPSLGGLFVRLGGDVMIRPTLGFGAAFSFRGSQGEYAGLNYRPLFYDFNAIYQPLGHTASKIAPELQAGLGGVDTKFFYSQSFCDQFGGCSTSNTYLESSHHFQLHFGGGVRLYVKGGLFVRPQVDVHWVNNFFQFGSNWVPEYSASVGYTFGRPP
jgi:hypothetical protein